MRNRRDLEVVTDDPKSFATEQEAADWMSEEVDDPYQDNDRFAFKDDPEAVKRYEEFQGRGCCGYFDADIIVAGRPAMIGCNFGH